MEEALEELKRNFKGIRDEIIVHTQFRRNVAVSPSDKDWGQPKPIDINGLIEAAFRAGAKAYERKLKEDSKKE